MVGNCGAGKSTLVEKLTGITGRGDNSPLSFTKTSEYFWVPDKSLEIADTPGSNPMREKFEHNFEIASVLSYRPVTKLFIVVKADVRKDEMISKIAEYSDRFVVLPLNLIGVIVTNMDIKERKWSEDEFTQNCDMLGIKDVVYSSVNKHNDQLLKDILNVCFEAHDFNIDTEMFLRMFKISKNNRKILKVMSDIVQRFEVYKDQFNGQRAKFSEKDQVDLYFEYKSFMNNKVEEARKEMADRLGFDFLDEEKSIENAGYLAQMMNQVRSILYDVRIAALKYQNGHGAADLRKCPHCGCIWAKVAGCDGETRCGEMASFLDSQDPELSRLYYSKDFVKYQSSAMATFTFELRGNQFLVSKTGNRKYSWKDTSNKGRNVQGCGKPITWSEMKKVKTPKELEYVPGDVNVNDIPSLPPQPQHSNRIRGFIDRRLGHDQKPPVTLQKPKDRVPVFRPKPRK